MMLRRDSLRKSAVTRRLLSFARTKAREYFGRDAAPFDYGSESTRDRRMRGNKKFAFPLSPAANQAWYRGANVETEKPGGVTEGLTSLGDTPSSRFGMAGKCLTCTLPSHGTPW